MNRNHSSTIYLDKKALANNLEFIRNLLTEKNKFSAVIKGNAYGHGAVEMMTALQELGVNHFSVFSAYEAKQVFSVLAKNSVLMIMGDIPDEDISWIVENEIEVFIYDFKSLQQFITTAKQQQKQVNIHIELETGMHRHGFDKKHWEKLLGIIKTNLAYIKLKGICTHFAGAESSANYKRIKDQQENFRVGVDFFKQAGLNSENLHTSSSAGAIAYPEWNLDLVRIGILLYGLWPSKEIQLFYRMKYQTTFDLQPVLSWHSSIMAIKEVKPGEYIGYGNSFLAEREMKVASVPVGYGYGFSRAMSNTGRVLVKGKRLPVIGMVNMNMFLIEVTDVEVEISDKVTLIGKDADQEIKVSYFGNLSDQLNYELLTRLDKSIPRKLI